MTKMWFEPETLYRWFDINTRQRGRDLFNLQRVLDLRIGRKNGVWVLDGRVQGSKKAPYVTSVTLAMNAQGQVTQWAGDCSCPVGGNCKHAVALSLKAAYRGHALATGISLTSEVSAKTGKTDKRRAAEQAQAALERAQQLAAIEEQTRLLRWLQTLQEARQTPVQQVSRRGLVSSQGVVDEVPVYLLMPGTFGKNQVLQIKLMYCATKLSGGWGRPRKPWSLPQPGSTEYERISAQDHDVLNLMRGLPDASGKYPGYGGGSTHSQVQGNVGVMALQAAQQTGRLFAVNERGGIGPALRWGDAMPLRWQWKQVMSETRAWPTVGASAGGAQKPALDAPLQWALRPGLDSPGAVLCHNQPLLYLDVEAGLCGLVDAGGLPQRQLDALLNAPAFSAEAMKAHQATLLEQLGPVPAPPVLEQVPTVHGVTPRFWLHIQPVPPALQATRGLLSAHLQFDYDGLRGWWKGGGASVLVERPGGKVLLHRMPEVEWEGMAGLMERGLQPDGEGMFYLHQTAQQARWMEWYDSDFAALKEAGYHVTLDDSMQDWISHVDTLDVDFRASGQEENDTPAGEGTSSWFDLSLGLEINGTRYNVLHLIPELVATAARSAPDPETGLPTLPPFVYMPRRDALTKAKGANDTAPPGVGGYVRLPTDALKPWLAALLDLVGDRDYDFDADTLRLSRMDALRTTAALGEGAVWDAVQGLRQLLQDLQGRNAIADVPVPASVKASLRPYQQLGLNWLQFLRTHSLGGILADDMGLGKTLQTLTHIQVEKDAGRLDRPALIIAPVSLMGNWRREAERFCPELRTLVLHGKDRHELAASMTAQDVVIAPYSLLQRDKERWLEGRWHLVVLDEAQNIKNATTYAAQVVGQLHTRHRLCLSGTPMENHLGEIWSLFHFLMPGFLGSQQRFKDLYRTPIEKQGDGERMAQLRARVTPFMLRRTKSLVASELPPKVETVTRVELSGKQADLYETIRLGMEKTVREALNTKGLAKSQITILDALLKLRQVCCDPNLLKLPAAKKVKTSAKLEQLMEMLPEMLAEGRRILLFSQFTSMLALIEVELKKRDIPWVKLTGQSQNREALIEQFTSGAVPLFLISLKAGGVGLNLPQADTVIHYDPWWNPAVENQATDRAHRIGQTQSVFVYKLVAQGTIEERILALQERKAQLAESMYSGAAERKQPLFTESDLSELLKPLGG